MVGGLGLVESLGGSGFLGSSGFLSAGFLSPSFAGLRDQIFTMPEMSHDASLLGSLGEKETS